MDLLPIPCPPIFSALALDACPLIPGSFEWSCDPAISPTAAPAEIMALFARTASSYDERADNNGLFWDYR
jgi:hypothetical protein